jgi:hypothetical protein
MQDVDARLAAKSAEDRAQARALILTGIPFALAAWLFLAILGASLPWFWGRWGYGPCFGLAGAVVALLMAVDTWRHPSEHWIRVRYFTPGLTHEPLPTTNDGIPLMASVTDPGNLAEHGRMMSSGCANLALGGPRNLRKGVELLRLARAREAAAPAVRALLGWLGERKDPSEADLAQALAQNELLRRGWHVARDAGLVALRGGQVLIK